MTSSDKFFDGLMNNMKNLFEKLPEDKKNDQLSILGIVKRELVEGEKRILAFQKTEDLKTVKELCKKHGFSVSSLKGSLVTRKSKKQTEIDKGNAK